jgi:hypothetical protein
VFNRILLKINPNWGFDQNEKFWIKSLGKTEKIQPSKGSLFIQSPQDYYILSLWFEATATARANKVPLVTLNPTIFSLKLKRDLLFPIRVVYTLINNFLRKRKWDQLYLALGVSKQLQVNENPVLKKLGLFKDAWKVWRKINNKEELLNLHLKGYYCGDLIYDTYLRYRIRPTVNISSISLLYFIYVAHCTIKNCEQLVKTYKIHTYFTSYTTYIQHGIPVRVFLKYDVDVYSAGNLQQRLKKLTQTDYYQTSTHKDYSKIFDTLSEKSDRIVIGNSLLQNKFKGVIDQSTAYMKSSAFSNSAEQANETLNFDGVIFLHDFYDSPHIYANMLFPDFYEWVEFTFKVILKHKLNIGVKPHPNQTAESGRDIEYLKQKYPSVYWINPATSNVHILNSGIKFGISIYGTVLHELAYHNIIPICAGDNPHTSFDFVFSPKSKEEYENMIINHRKLALPPDCQDQVAAFYYMHNVYPKGQINFDDSKLYGHNIITGSSDLLSKILS